MNTNTANALPIDCCDTKKPSFLKRIQKKITNSPYSYLFYCFLVPVVLNYLVYLAMEIHPFGDGSVLVLDLNAQYVYFFEALRNFVHGDGDMLYSFSRALGGEFVGIYAYYIASPLSYIVALFPKERMLEALLTLFLLKTGLCGLTFGFYLHKNSKQRNRVMIIAFSAMYALSAYAVIHQNNNMWIDALIWLPLLTYGIEQLVKFGKFKLFVISLALTIWSNYYIGYMVCIYVAAYFFFYLFAYGDGRNNPRKEKAHNLKSFIRIAVFSVIAVAMAMFIILGAYYSLTFGKNEFSNPDWSIKANFKLLDFFTKFLPGSYDTVRPEGLPFVYTGILTLILVPVFFMSKKISSREKVGSLGFIVFFVISFIANPLDLIWHGFQAPNWLNNRYSFMLCFFLIVLAYKGFGNLRKVSEKFIFGVSSFIILFVAVCEKQEFETYVESDKELLTLETVWLSVIATVVFLVLLCLLMRIKGVRRREGISGVLAAMVCVELFCSSLACVVQFDRDVVYSGYKGYNNFLKDMRLIVDEVKENDNGFYRLENNGSRKVNDSMALATKGLSGSTSTLNRETIKFLNRMGYASKSHWSRYLGGTPVNDSLLGIKYIIDNQSSTKLDNGLYSPTYFTEKHTAYLNPYALSLAYGVNSAVKDFDTEEEESHFERLNLLVSAMLGEEKTLKIFKPIPVLDEITSDCEVSSIAGHQKYEAETKSGTSVTFKITAPKDGDIFFYAPSKYTRECELFVNGRKEGTFFGNDTNRIITLGKFTEGQEVDVRLVLKKDELYLSLRSNYFYFIDEDLFKESFTRLKNGPQFNIDDGCKDSYITGTITTSNANQTVFSSVPFDKGWKVSVDGVEVETYETLNALMAFDIESEGEHTLTFEYSPAIYKVGATISIIGIVAFVIICIIDLIYRKSFKKFFGKDSLTVEDSYWVLEDFDEDFIEESALPAKCEESKSGCALLEKIKKAFTKKSKSSENTEESTKKDFENDGNSTQNKD